MPPPHAARNWPCTRVPKRSFPDVAAAGRRVKYAHFRAILLNAPDTDTVSGVIASFRW